MQKKIKTRVLIAGCLALLLITATFAIWSGRILHTNELKADHTSAKVEETFEQDAKPSGTVVKKVAFKNESSNAAFLRVSYAETWEKEDGDNKVLLNNQVKGVDVATKNWKDGFGSNNGNWYAGSDGWFYYTKILEPGSSTQEILESVKFPEYSGDYAEYKDADYQLYFRMELLQVSDSQSTLNSSEVNEKASTTVFGKKAKVDGENVSWQ